MSRVFSLCLVLLAWWWPVVTLAGSTELFQQHCAACHGAQGQGATGIPNLVDNVWQYGGTLEDIERSITYGRHSIMPALGAPLGDDGLNQVVGYVQSLSAPAERSGDDLAAGETLFMTFCGSCHGEQGAGTPALGAPDLTDDVWLYGGDTATLRDVISNGRANEMPGFAATLTSTELAAMAAFIKGMGETG